MRQLIVLRGLPGSGLTFRAKQIVENDQSFIRMSKKEDFSGFTIPIMKVSTSYISRFHKTLKDRMQNGDNIVIDDNNLDPLHHHYYSVLAQKYNYNIKFEFLETSLKDCIMRCRAKKSAQSTKIVDSDINIISLAKKYNLCIEELNKTTAVQKDDKEYVVYDLDGVVANISDRIRLCTSPQGELILSKFNDPYMYRFDIPNKDISDMMWEDMMAGYEVVILSARPDSHYSAVKQWLTTHTIPYNDLVLKNPDTQLTKEGLVKMVSLKRRKSIGLCKRIVDNNENTLSVFKKLNISTVLYTGSKKC